MGTINTRSGAYWNADDDPGTYSEAWMQLLSDSHSISQLSIPGTHNSMARFGIPWVWCQSLPLDTQIRSGVRFFDIRCRHSNNTLLIHHDMCYQNASLTHVLSELLKFLDGHPTEAVLMRIREEYKAKDNTVSFLESLRGCVGCFPQERFWLQNAVPTLGECRGKIVVLDNFSGGFMGIDWKSADIEDTWDTDPDDKWNRVTAHIEKAQGSPNDELYITFASFIHRITLPRDLARSLNPKLHSFVSGRKGKLGIIVCDFPGPKLISDIIACNFA